jgi:hypothetical protein
MRAVFDPVQLPICGPDFPTRLIRGRGVLAAGVERHHAVPEPRGVEGVMPLVGSVEARIWRNDSKERPYHTVRLFRFYSSGEGQHEAGSFR